MRRLILLLFFLPFSCASLNAQPGTATRSDSIETTILPIIAFTSDVGLLGGGVYNRFDYRGGAEPFRNRFQTFVAASTKGFILAEARYDQILSFSTDIRTVTDLFLERLALNSYFGVGNETTFDEQLWENDFYFFESVRFGLTFTARKPIWKDGGSRFDLLAGLGTEYQIPFVIEQSSKFNIDRPVGSSGGWINFLKTGFIFENRNSEFNPTGGNRLEASFRYAPTFLLSDYEMASARIEYRQYLRLIRFVTLAMRFEGRHTIGDVPYWELSALGDRESLRGYPLNRFLGTSSMLYNVELRKWILEFPDYGIKFGGQLFTDFGRVFTREDDLENIFKDYRQTFGFGGAMALTESDFIFRGDIGFSEDDIGIYVGVGYIF